MAGKRETERGVVTGPTSAFREGKKADRALRGYNCNRKRALVLAFVIQPYIIMVTSSFIFFLWSSWFPVCMTLPLGHCS